ncbi:unnamed protein product [Echinostoma caproni]|uniref:Uncharacterized protein n=1 Tax=Echinostoma caproni TaxID=27848 RepID=A0A183ALK3_9TREM|nr:unnamed protein product [Echinostoma caproni]
MRHRFYFQTFSTEQAHVSTSERGCPIRQASCESLLPKQSANACDHTPIRAYNPTNGSGLCQMESNDQNSSPAQSEFAHTSGELALKRSNRIRERAESNRVLDADYRIGFCDHPLTASAPRTNVLEANCDPSVIHCAPTSNNVHVTQSADIVEGDLSTVSITRPGTAVSSQPSTPVITDYPEAEHSSSCCLCGVPCCHCQTQCFPSKSTPNRCNTCAIQFLPSSCSSVCFSSSWCGWRWNRWRRRRIPNENLLVLSVIQLLCGFAAIILSSVALTKAVFLYQMATGMWAGFLMLITGTQGLIASRRPIVCTLTGLLTLCVVVTVAACLLICVSVAGTIEDGFLDHVNLRSRSQHQTIKLTYSFHPSPGGLQKSDQFYSLTYHGMPDNRTISRLSWGAIRQLYSDRTSSHFVNPSQDTHLRTCQVILHVLLLLVGILESSVSLSTCVLCCRYVCSRSGRFGSSQNPFATRTNIVSLNAATANQAASVLRSGELNQFIGSGDVLLAVSAGTPSDAADPSFNFLRQNLSGMEPCVHPSVAPFLPQLNRPALILTQAGTGAMAWTAARAAATLIFQPHLRRHRRDGRHNATDRPHLLFTSLSTLNNRNSSGNQNGSVTNSSSVVAGLPSCPPGSTLIYVMPSPNSDSPPMIFPPFPPVYSSLQKRPSTFNTPRRSGHGDRRVTHTHRSSAGGTTRSRSTRPSEHTRLDRSITRRYLSRIFTWHRNSPRRNNRSSETRTRRPSPRASNSALICAGGNRLLQPVLIIEDPDIFQMNSTDPPPYSAIDQSPRPSGQTSSMD